MDNSSFELSKILITLLKGVLYREKQAELWHELPSHLTALNHQVNILGLDLIIDENEGYAYLRQKEYEDENDALPKLVNKRQMSYHVSLLCILLRKKLLEVDAAAETTRAIISRNQIVDSMRIYMQDANNEVKQISVIDTAIRKVVELGFLRELKNKQEMYEIRRIIKALIEAETVSKINDKLKEYQEYISDSE